MSLQINAEGFYLKTRPLCKNEINHIENILKPTQIKCI